MALYTTFNSSALATEEMGETLVQEMLGRAVVFQTTNVVRTSATEYHYPVVTADPSAGWYAEGADIAETSATVIEESVVPKKLAALSKLSRELVNDNSSSVQMSVNSLVNDLSRKADQAFFSAVATPAPAGLESLTGVNVITTPAGETAWVDFDVFAAAISAAQEVTADVTAFVANPADALALQQLKQATGSNVPLLGNDATSATKRSILGVPLYVSPFVTVGTVWGIPQDRVLSVVRADAEVLASEDFYFGSDSVALRGVTRVAYGFPHEVAIQKIQLATA